MQWQQGGSSSPPYAPHDRSVSSVSVFLLLRVRADCMKTAPNARQPPRTRTGTSSSSSGSGTSKDAGTSSGTGGGGGSARSDEGRDGGNCWWWCMNGGG